MSQCTFLKANVNLPLYPGKIRLRDYDSRETTEELLLMHKTRASVEAGPDKGHKNNQRDGTPLL